MSELKIEGTHLELQGYRMINTSDGSRLAEAGEQTGFYDISVLIYREKTGEIDPVEEVEDMPTFEQANQVMEELEEKYSSESLIGEWVN
jgi:hypothetical protein